MHRRDLSTSLTDTGQRLACLDHDLGFVTTVPPNEPGWIALDAAIQPHALDGFATDILDETSHRTAAASYLASRLTQPVVSRTVAAIVVDRRCPDPSLSSIVMHRHKNKLDRIAFTGPCAVVAGDPATLEPGTLEVPDQDALRDWWARKLVAALTPVLEASRARLRFSRRGMWSIVATRIGSTAAGLDRRRGGTGEDGWAEATRLMDALAEHAPVRFTRPKPLPVAWDGCLLWHATKATCCLKYHTKPVVDRASGLGYCSTCPLVDSECRVTQLTNKLAIQQRA